MIADNPHMIKIGQTMFNQNWVVSSIDQVSKSIYFEKKEIHYRDDRPILDVMEERAKYGVKVDIHTGDIGDEFLKVEVDHINQKLEEVAKMDPVKDKDAIAGFYGLKYKPELAMEAHKKLVKAIKSLGSKDSMVEVKYKTPTSIKEDYIQADDRKIILPAPDSDGENDEGGAGAVKGSPSFTDFSFISAANT